MSSTRALDVWASAGSSIHVPHPGSQGKRRVPEGTVTLLAFPPTLVTRDTL